MLLNASEMSRLVRTILSFWSTSLATEFEYKLNFLIELISTIGNLIGSIFILSLFYNDGHTLGGWTWSSALVVLGMYTILEGFTTIFLQPNLSRIVRHVQNGTLDFVLLKPVSSQLWLSFRLFSPWGFPSLLCGVCLIIYGSIKNETQFFSSSFLISSLLVFSSLIILYNIWFMLATTSIWFVKVWNVNEVLRSTLVAGRYPISAYPPILRVIFTFVLPIAFLTTIPAQGILGIASIDWIIGALSITLFSLFCSINLWRYALRFYTSASS